MKTATQWRAGSASDPGLQRSINEDRVLVDEARGIFLVVDGLGGHAAGEIAAETAVHAIDETLSGTTPIDEEQIRFAITSANNRIFEQAGSDPALRGMACVLTLAVATGDRLLVGHVGDSRLYLLWNGKLRKITSDHSPVGELEDHGDINEAEAMQHPRRNEVFRDVGSYRREPDDPEFIEIKSIPFRPDAAVLLCSDGLSDLLTSAQITRLMERYSGNPGRIAAYLVEAANAAGGRDNISVIFIPGPEFIGSESDTLSDARPRHATTRMRGGKAGFSNVLRNILLLFGGMLIGLFLWRVIDRYANQAVPRQEVPAVHVPRDIAVNSADSLGIIKALAGAQPGDSIKVPPGEYLGPIVLKDRITIIAIIARQAVLHNDPASTTDPGVVILARGVNDARVKGLRVTGDETHPLRTGLLIDNSSIEAEDLDVSGAIDSAIRIEGDSHPLVLGNYLHGNSGTGVIIRAPSVPRLVGNRISENGLAAGSLHAGVEIDSASEPVLQHNEIVDNGLLPVFPAALNDEIRAKNTIEAARPSKPKPIARPSKSPAAAKV